MIKFLRYLSWIWRFSVTFWVVFAIIIFSLIFSFKIIAYLWAGLCIATAIYVTLIFIHNNISHLKDELSEWWDDRPWRNNE